MSVAWLSSVIDWDTCKLQYEVLGDSLDRVAETHNLEPDAVSRVAASEGWAQLDQESTSLQGMTSYLVDVQQSLQVKLDLASIYREIEMLPRIMAIEDLLVDKVQESLRLIDTSDSRSPSALRALGQTLYAVAERKHRYSTGDELGQDDTNYTVEIVSAADKAIARAEKLAIVQHS